MKPLHSQTLLRLRWPLAIGGAALLTGLLLWGLVVRYDIKLSTEAFSQMPLIARLRLAAQAAVAADKPADGGAAQAGARKSPVAAPATPPPPAESAPPNTGMTRPNPTASAQAPDGSDTQTPPPGSGAGLAWPPHSSAGNSAGLGSGMNAAKPASGTGTGAGSQGAASQGDEASAACYAQTRPTSADYPPRAIDDNIRHGRVKLRLSINADGMVDKSQVIAAQPPGYFERAAQRLALRWRCEPRAAAYSVIAPIEFDLR